MGFFWACFTTIAFCFTLIIVRCFGELIVLRYPTTNDGSERKLACVTEDDDAALIWNTNYDADGRSNVQNGYTNKPSSRNINDCAIWNSTLCLACKWGYESEWEVVNSAFRPMGPVLDYRWEEFNELVIKEKKNIPNNIYSGEVSANTLVVSVRGYRVTFFLCEIRTNNSCLWIILGNHKDKVSELRICDKNKSCHNISKSTPENVLDRYEWRTFTLNWNSDENTVKIFKDTDPDNKPFLQGKINVSEWVNVSDISIKSDKEVHFRFHFYDYYWTVTSKSLLYLEVFDYYDKNFCAELLVGLCPKCSLQIYLSKFINDDPHSSDQIQMISGHKKSLHNKLLTWQSVKLTAAVTSTNFVLTFRTVLDQNGSGQWAIGNLKMCKPVDSLRESIITNHRGNTSATWPLVKCQKLSNEKINLVNAVSESTININNENKLPQSFSRQFRSRYSCWEKSGKNFSICNLNGCTRDQEFSKIFFKEVPSSKESQKPSLLTWFLIIPPTLAIFLVLLLVRCRNRKRIWKQMEETIYIESLSLSSTTSTTSRQLRPPTYLEVLPPLIPSTSTSDLTDLDQPEISLPQSKATENRISNPYALPIEPDSCSVNINNFEDYVKHATVSGLLYSQFMLFRRGLTKPCDYGKLPENMPKNRCRYLIAYDHSRVILRKIPGDPYSDYINASYIKRDENERAYIATQGPTPNTINDFWRMVWQDKVRVICMLTNVIEDTETKCEKYWPDVGAWVKHGDFHISNIEDQVFADYTFRTFEISYKLETRKVMHLHYTRWPSLGIPTHPQSLVTYLKKLRQTSSGNGPIVVHCSTGDDRTGTMILSDICLRQAIAKKVIDVTAVTTRMRDSRANMVGTLQQYLLAHIIITESIVYHPTQIPCIDVLSTRMKQLRMRLPYNIQRLNDSNWQERALQSSAAKRAVNDRMPDVVVEDSEVTYDDVFEKECNHINAVKVDGVKVKNQYLACQLPSLANFSNFWRFIAKRNIKLIIILQCSEPRDPTCSDIIPDELTTVPMLDIRVKNETSLDEEEFFTNQKLSLTDTSEASARSQSVVVLTCRGWRCDKNQKPPPPGTLISLWRATETISRKAGETLVLCHNGITGCGLYLALSFLLERMVVEKECDVISAVRAVRRSRPEFIQSLAQFDYLYDAAVNYVEYFQT